MVGLEPSGSPRLGSAGQGRLRASQLHGHERLGLRFRARRSPTSGGPTPASPSAMSSASPSWSPCRSSPPALARPWRWRKSAPSPSSLARPWTAPRRLHHRPPARLLRHPGRLSPGDGRSWPRRAQGAGGRL
ncbi:hypothetical protein ACRAWD_10550 [Caulobacter segnis]